MEAIYNGTKEATLDTYPGEDLSDPVLDDTNVYMLLLRGATPLLQHNPVGNMGKRGGRLTAIPEPAVEARRGLYITDDDTVFHPADGLRHSLICAGLGFKAGKSSWSPKIQKGLFAMQTRMILLDPDTLEPLSVEGYSVDVRRAVVQSQGVLRARPRWDRWATRCFVECDPAELEIGALGRIAEFAGRTEGLGDFRPSTKAGKGRGGPFGRFSVEITTIR